MARQRTEPRYLRDTLYGHGSLCLQQVSGFSLPKHLGYLLVLTPFCFFLSLGLCMNTGWELGRGERAGEKDLVDTGGKVPGG